MRRSSLVLSAAALTAALGAGAWQGARLLGDDDGDRRAAVAFANAWVAGEVPELADVTAGLTPGDGDRPSEVSVVSVRRDGDRARAVLGVRWELGAAWDYRTELPLQRTDDVWQPVVGPSVAHPDLDEGDALRSRLVQAARAPITDRAGTPIVQDRPVVTVGLQPSRATDLAATVARVAELTGVEAPGLLERARSARPDHFVEVVVLRREAYDAVRPELRPVPGVVLQEGTRQLAPTPAFARALLGSVGPATAEVVEQREGRVRADQSVGLSGLQRQYDDRLGGTPGLEVEVVDVSGEVVRSLASTAPVPGTPLQLTLDPAVQTAADAALATAPEGKGAALVVVQPSTGDVLAVANAGPDGPGVDRALTGRYPPGSTFKTASALALLRGGLQVDEAVPCPATTSVDGKSFKNAEDEVLGDQPFSVDFAHSCNTAFVGSADRVSSTQLEAAARDLGLMAYDLELDAFGADVPVTDDAVEHAAQVIGQGRVLASPLAVAVAAATVESGRLRLPRLLAEAPVSAPGPELAEAADLQALTRSVVTDGTGAALRDVPGEPVRGKTGTAEYGTHVPPRTHAWFAGSSGDLAFAVLVEDGGFGGQTAAPIAAQLLRALR